MLAKLGSLQNRNRVLPGRYAFLEPLGGFQSSLASFFGGDGEGALIRANVLAFLYDDAAGTTAHDGDPGDPVGLALDSRFGGQRGAEHLESDYNSNAAYYTEGNGATLSFDSGVIVITGGVTDFPYVSYKNNTLGLTDGEWYEFEIEFDAPTPTAFRWGLSTSGNAFVSGSSPNLPTASESGRFIAQATSTSDTFSLQLNTTADNQTARVSRLSIKPLPGFHAFQSVSASRLVWARMPVVGIVNELAHLNTPSENFTDSNWLKERNDVISDDLVTSSRSVDKLRPTAVSGTHTLIETLIPLNAGVVSMTGTAKADGYDFIVFRLDAGTTNGAFVCVNVSDGTIATSAQTAGTGWSDASATVTETEDGLYEITLQATTPTTGNLRFIVFVCETASGYNGETFTGDGASGIHFTGAQIQNGAFSAYQKVTNQYNVTQSGQPNVYELVGDGVQKHAIGSIDVIDDATIFASCRHNTGSIVGDETILSLGNSADADTLLHIFFDSSSGKIKAAWNDDAGSGVIEAEGPDIDADPHVVGAKLDSGNNQLVLYVDGIAYTAAITHATTTFDQYGICALNSTAVSNYFNGGVTVLAPCEGLLTDTQIQNLGRLLADEVGATWATVPASLNFLFANDEEGFYFPHLRAIEDNATKKYFYQEAGCRNLCTAYGDPIGAWIDKNPNNSQTLRLVTEGASGEYVSTPDSAALDITGDIEIIAHVAADDWAGGTYSILSKWDTTSSQRSYYVYLTAPGRLNFAISSDGTIGTQVIYTSSENVPFSDYEEGYIKITVDVDNGSGDSDCTFYISEDGEVWTQLGTVQNSGSTETIFAGTSNVSVGANVAGTNNNFPGHIYRVIVKDGIDGTTVADFNPALDYTPGTSGDTFDSSTTGETYTLNGDVRIAPAGLHALQKTSAARPILARRPKTGIDNIIFAKTGKASEDFESWTLENVTVDNDAFAGPFSGTFYASVTGTSSTSSLKRLYLTTTALDGPTCFSFILKKNSGVVQLISNTFFNGNDYANIDTSDGSYSGSFAATDFFDVSESNDGSGWVVQWTESVSTASGWWSILRVDSPSAARGANSTSTDPFYIAACQIEENSGRSAYQKVVSQYDVTESGVPDTVGPVYDGTAQYFDMPRTADRCRYFHDGTGVTFAAAFLYDAADDGANHAIMGSRHVPTIAGAKIFVDDGGSNTGRITLSISDGSADIITATSLDNLFDRYSPQTIMYTYLTQSGTDVFIYLDNVEEVVGTELGTPTSGPAEADMQLGAKGSSTELFTGEIPSLLGINRVLTAAERYQVAKYFANISGADV